MSGGMGGPGRSLSSQQTPHASGVSEHAAASLALLISSLSILCHDDTIFERIQIKVMIEIENIDFPLPAWKKMT